MAKKNIKDAVMKYNDNATEISIEVETVSPQNITPEQTQEQAPESKTQRPTDDEGNVTYVMTDSVLINSKGVHVVNKWGWKNIANFPFLVKHVINFINDEGEEDCSFIVQVGNDADLNMGDPIYFNISNRDFSSCSKTRTIFRRKQYTLRGKEDDFFQVLDAMPKVAETETVDTLGWNDKAKAFFFANVVLKDGKLYSPDEFGLVELEKESYFMPFVDSITGKKNSKLAETFKYCEDSNITFNKWYQLFHDAHLTHSYLPTCFALATMFRDIIYKDRKFFPLLFLKGPGGSGKSTITRSLTSLFGMQQEVQNLSAETSTPKGISDLLAQKSNCLVWLDEFNNDLNKQYMGILQSAYDGAGRSRATKNRNKDIDSVPMKSTIAISANFTPDYEVLYTRILLENVEKTQFTDEQKMAFDALTDLEKENLTPILKEILEYRGLIEKEFKAEYTALFKYFREQVPQIQKTRYFDNMAAVLAPAMILLKHNKIFMESMNFADKLKEHCKNLLREQWDTLMSNDKSVEFWNVVQNLFNKGIIRKGVELKLVDGLINDLPIADGLLAVRYEALYLEYQRFLGNKARGSQEIKTLLLQSDYFCEQRKSQRFMNPEGKSCVSSAICFNYEKLQKMGLILD